MDAVAGAMISYLITIHTIGILDFTLVYRL